MNHRDLFEDLFVLEMANNHWGRVDRGLEIIRQPSERFKALVGASVAVARAFATRHDVWALHRAVMWSL